MSARALGILIFFLVIFFFCQAQSKQERLKELYGFVDKADSFSDRSHRTFYLEKYLDDNFNYKETWRFAERDGRVIYFQIDFILDSTEHTEVYYVNRGNLVCSEEYEKVNYSFAEDELKKGGVYYFQGAVPQHMVMLGQSNDRDPGLTVLQRFEKRFSELKRHLPMLP